MIERPPVGREGDAIRGEQTAREFRETSPIVAVEMRLAAVLRLVDGAGQEAARRIDAAVVEAAGAVVLGIVRELRLATAFGIEQPQTRAETRDEAATFPEADASDLLGHRHDGMPARRRVKAMERHALDVDEKSACSSASQIGHSPSFGANIEGDGQRHLANSQ